MSSNFRQIRLLTTELAVLERLKHQCLHFFSVGIDPILFKVGGFCSASSTNKIEKIQERALRFINNDFTSSLQALLTSTNTLPLHVRRMKQMASEVYKIVNDIAPAYIKDLVNIKKN